MHGVHGVAGSNPVAPTFIMVLIIPILFVNVIFVVIALGINKKNAKYLLAGYNTMSMEQREKFDIEGFLIFFKKYFLQVAFYSTLIFIFLSLLVNPGAAIIGYTFSIILPTPYLIIMGNRFNK
tara:strand:+ start:397 stop:765 length:369 start_codon:yes stop_codon:yes gene_type:complete